jgi:hypothetical protein
MKLAKNISIILCDDIREEKGSKLSFLGVYGIYNSDIVVDKIPAVLPKLCLAIMLSETQILIEKCEVTIVLPDKEKLQITSPEAPNNEIGKNITLGFMLSPFKINSTGEVNVFFRFNDEKKLTLKFKFHILARGESKK